MAMVSKSTLVVLGFLVLFTTNVSSNDEELIMKVDYAKPPVSAVAPVPAPPVKPPTAPPPPAAKAPIPPPPAESPTPAPKPPAPAAPIVRSNKDCPPLCENRCQLHSRKRVCMRACGTCCERCKCVPPGTYGNREVCGKCYTDMLTHGNRYKCP